MLAPGTEALWCHPALPPVGGPWDVATTMTGCGSILSHTRVPTHKGLTHWGRVTHICVGNITIISSDNGLSPYQRQAIIWTNAAILLIGTLGTNFNEIVFKIHTSSFKNIHLKMASGKWRPFCLGLNVLTHWGRDKMAAISQFQMHFLEWKCMNFAWNFI